MVINMSCRIGELRNKQIVCVKNGCVLGFVSDVDIDISSGNIAALVIFGRLRLLGLLGREDDIVIPWKDISVIGSETILVNTDPETFLKSTRRGIFTM